MPQVAERVLFIIIFKEFVITKYLLSGKNQLNTQSAWYITVIKVVA